MSDLWQRVDALEGAIIALGRQELGDFPGHDFHGNQYSDGVGVEERAARRERIKALTPEAKRELSKGVRLPGDKPPPAPPRPREPKILTRDQLGRQVDKHLRAVEVGLGDVKRDMPEVSEDDAWHDITMNQTFFIDHPLVKADFLRRSFGFGYPGPSETEYSKLERKYLA